MAISHFPSLAASGKTKVPYFEADLKNSEEDLVGSDIQSGVRLLGASPGFPVIWEKSDDSSSGIDSHMEFSSEKKAILIKEEGLIQIDGVLAGSLSDSSHRVLRAFSYITIRRTRGEVSTDYDAGSEAYNRTLVSDKYVQSFGARIRVNKDDEVQVLAFSHGEVGAYPTVEKGRISITKVLS